MGKFFKSLVLTSAAGAAIAYVFGTKKGQELKEKAQTLANDYREDPAGYNQLAKETVLAYKDLAVETFRDYKERLETGELTKEDLLQSAKDKVTEVADLAADKVNQVKDSLAGEGPVELSLPDVETEESSEDIVIDLTEDQA